MACGEPRGVGVCLRLFLTYDFCLGMAILQQNTLNLHSMKTKILSLMLTIASCVCFFSCSEDETPMDKVLTNVEGSKWITVSNSVSYELYFKNGYYTLDYISDHESYSIMGTYTQDNLKISFEKKPFITYTILAFKDGEISQSGTSMQVPVYYDHSYAETDIAETLRFTLCLE